MKEESICKMKEEARSSPLPWPDLPAELLGLVLLRLPSLLDRVRLRAVCRPWRSNARMQGQPLPRPLPWISFLDGTSLSVVDGTCLSIPDAKIIRMPLLPDGPFCCGSNDSSLFFVRRYGGGCSLVSPFSNARRLDLPDEVNFKRFLGSPMFNSCFQKMVVSVSSSPLGPKSSQGSIAVAVILDDGMTIRMYRGRPPISSSLSIRTLTQEQPPYWIDHLDDIAFFNGKLYGLHGKTGELLMFELNHGPNGKPNISHVECITGAPSVVRVVLPEILSPRSYVTRFYLVECCGRLLMVKRMIEYNQMTREYGPTAGFDVFEADLSTTPGQWRCLSNLGGQALFVGRHGSKSVPAGGCTGVQEDCIYFMCDYRWYHPVDPLHDSGAYNIRNGIITPLLSDTAYVPKYNCGDIQWRLTWFFPADADAIMESNPAY